MNVYEPVLWSLLYPLRQKDYRASLSIRAGVTLLYNELRMYFFFEHIITTTGTLVTHMRETDERDSFIWWNDYDYSHH